MHAHGIVYVRGWDISQFGPIYSFHYAQHQKNRVHRAGGDRQRGAYLRRGLVDARDPDLRNDCTSPFLAMSFHSPEEKE